MLKFIISISVFIFAVRICGETSPFILLGLLTKFEHCHLFVYVFIHWLPTQGKICSYSR